MRAERRAGELLRDMAERGERAVRKNMKSQPATSKLSDLGINKTKSPRWQRLAALDADSFEAKIEGASKRAYDGITYRFLKQAEIARVKQRHGKIIEHGCTDDDLVDSSIRQTIPRSSMPTRLGLGTHWADQADMSTPHVTTIMARVHSMRSCICRSLRWPPMTVRCCCGVPDRTSASGLTSRSSGRGA